MNHILVSLGINNWDRVRSLWELLVRGRWLSVPNWQTWCVSSQMSSEQTSNLTCHIDQSPWVSYSRGCGSAMRAQWELSLLCMQERFTVPPKWASYVPLHQDFYWTIEGISHWLEMKGIEHLTCIVPQTVPQYSVYYGHLWVYSGGSSYVFSDAFLCTPNRTGVTWPPVLYRILYRLEPHPGPQNPFPNIVLSHAVFLLPSLAVNTS